MRALLLSLLFLCPASGLAQFTPTKEPKHAGVRATADLPTSEHKRNVGGSDGLGLCVYTSAWHASRWQSVDDLYGFRAFMERRPGGSFPQKFDADLAAYCRAKQIPVPGYIQHNGGDVEFLKLALKTGRMVCITYCGVDDFYGAEVIAHMVNLLYLDDQQACILDNNRPGEFLWMSADDLVARWRGVQKDGRAYMVRVGPARWSPVGGGWAIVLLDPPPTPYPTVPVVEDRPAVVAPLVQVGQFRRAAQPSCPGGVCPIPTTPTMPATPFAQPTCPGGVCPLPGSSASLFGATPVGSPPAPDYDWAPVGASRGGWGWVQRSATHELRDRGDGVYEWFPRAKIVAPRLVGDPQSEAPAPRELPKSADPFPGGVRSDKLIDHEGYSISGRPVDKATALAAIAAGGLTDDSDRWHLATVGDDAFCTAVRADVAKLPKEVREKIHVQCYAPTSWQAKQFDLLPGLTLRKPATNRVGSTAGVLAPTGYTAARLDELLAPISGKTPAPMPGPKAPDEPGPKIEPAPTPEPAPAPTPAPAPDRGALLAILAAILAAILGAWRR